jgi:hypothetical protein
MLDTRTKRPKAHSAPLGLARGYWDATRCGAEAEALEDRMVARVAPMALCRGGFARLMRSLAETRLTAAMMERRR